MYFILDKYIMHNCSLFQTDEAQLFQKHNENQGSHFQMFKPVNSLVPYKLLYYPGTDPVVALSILSVSEDCLAFILSFPFISLCVLASLLFLPSLLTPSSLRFLVLACPCFITWINCVESSWCGCLSAVCALASGVTVVSTFCQWMSLDESHLWVYL